MPRGSFAGARQRNKFARRLKLWIKYIAALGWSAFDVTTCEFPRRSPDTENDSTIGQLHNHVSAISLLQCAKRGAKSWASSRLQVQIKGRYRRSPFWHGIWFTPNSSLAIDDSQPARLRMVRAGRRSRPDSSRNSKNRAIAGLDYCAMLWTLRVTLAEKDDTFTFTRSECCAL